MLGTRHTLLVAVVGCGAKVLHNQPAPVHPYPFVLGFRFYTKVEPCRAPLPSLCDDKQVVLMLQASARESPGERSSHK